MFIYNFNENSNLIFEYYNELDETIVKEHMEE